MKLWKSTIWSLLVATFTAVMGYSGYTIFAASIDDYKDEFKDSTDSFETVKSNYHSAMNDYFNEKMDLLIDLMEEDDFHEKSDYKSDGECGEKNVSSYCVSMGALDLYIAYIETILAVGNELPERDESTKIDVLFTDISLREESIEKEIEHARNAMEETMKIYDEFKTAYPVHKKYEEIIKSLNRYKVAIKNVREEVEEFPGRFIDATSPICK